MSAEIAHVRELAEDIGPRPATSDAEARAADYIERVFGERGLEVERQEFSSPRTYAWAYALYHTLTLACAAAVGVPVLRWPAFVVASATAVAMWLDLDTRRGLSSLMPKGASQNVIARHVPKVRRGEKTRRVIVVAHYDSARSSLAFAPSMARRFNLTFGLMKAITFAVPLMVLAGALPVAEAAQPWLWYATMAVSAYLLVPLFINAHRELFMPHVDGANDNASGVAAMLGVMERIVPEPDEYDRYATQPIRRAEEDVWAADVVPDGAVLSYSPVSPPARATVDFGDDISWTDPDEPSPSREVDVAQGELDLDGQPSSAEPAAVKTDAERRSMTDWLGVGKGFDARKRGREIGSWDNFDEDGDDDDFGVKGGSAPHDPLEDPEFSSTEASRIRRKVTEGIDRDLAEKEVWFVATGAEEVGPFGMKAFIDAYAEELEDAFIINIDGVGIGNLFWVTSEGMARRYHCDRRLAGTAKRVAAEQELRVAGCEYRGLSTDATPALARRLRAMSVMAFDINGRIPNWHWKTDTVDAISADSLVAAAEFVTSLIREL